MIPEYAKDTGVSKLAAKILNKCPRGTKADISKSSVELAGDFKKDEHAGDNN